MLKWTTRPVLIVLLGLMMVLGQSLSVLSAGEMWTSGIIAVDGDGKASMPCDDRDENGGQGKSVDCQSTCATVGHAMLPAASSLPCVEYIREPAPESRLSAGRTTRPEPHPPKRLIPA